MVELVTTHFVSPVWKFRKPGTANHLYYWDDGVVNPDVPEWSFVTKRFAMHYLFFSIRVQNCQCQSYCRRYKWLRHYASRRT
jgi:hypothetical protein